jgi:hypothetical protein
MEKDTNFIEEYSLLIGFLLLAFVIIILLSTPSSILASSITTIDTELSHASGDETLVRTLMDFGNNEHIAAFPMVIGDWRGNDYDTAKLKESLGADVMLLRAYSHPEIRQLVFFHILQSNNLSSFHPPIVCYPALGYAIEEEGKENISVQNVSWATKPMYPVLESRKEECGCFNGTFSAKKLIVVKESKEDGKVTERRVVLYFYVKDNPLSSDTVTIVRVSALAPADGSYESALNICKDFMGDTFPYMFEFREGEDIIAVQLAKSGIGGWLIIGALVSVPIGIIVYLRIKKRKESS